MSWHYDQDDAYGEWRLDVEGLLDRDTKKEVATLIQSRDLDPETLLQGLETARNILSGVDPSGESNNVSIGMLRLYRAQDVIRKVAANEFDLEADEEEDEVIRRIWKHLDQPYSYDDVDQETLQRAEDAVKAEMAKEKEAKPQQ